MRLLVLIPDRLSALVQKGEITPRYYNPGNLFDEVHILMCNDDKVDPRDVQHTVGTARLTLHNLPEESRYWIQSTPFFKPWLLKPWAKPLFTLANWYQFRLLDQWAKPAVELARQIQPALIRCHGNDYNAYVASCIKRRMGIPYVVSFHSNSDAETRRRIVDAPTTWQDEMFAAFFDRIEITGAQHADLLLPVYQSIIPYLTRIGCAHYQVAYNVLNSNYLGKKESYALCRPVRLVSVGRQFRSKNPENIIRAVQDLPGTQLTLIGDGAYHDRLRNLAHTLQLEDRVLFQPSLSNDELCRQLPSYDIFVAHNNFWGISKAMLEALLTGMPAIANQRVGGVVPEMQGDFLMLVENTKEGYGQAIRKLIEDDAFREQLGRKAYAHAQEHWAPAKTEAKYVEIYKRVMAQNRTQTSADERR